VLKLLPTSNIDSINDLIIDFKINAELCASIHKQRLSQKLTNKQMCIFVIIEDALISEVFAILELLINYTPSGIVKKYPIA
jgi:hypothetical protein